MDNGAWPWIWLAAAAFLAVGELAMPGTFFLVSFAIGAVIACIFAFAGVDVAVQWFVFVAGSAVALGVLVPLGRRMSHGGQLPVGATRFHGQTGTVLEIIPAGPNEVGLVRVEREEWRATSVDGRPIEVGVAVDIVRVDGTRLVVQPHTEASP